VCRPKTNSLPPPRRNRRTLDRPCRRRDYARRQIVAERGVDHRVFADRARLRMSVTPPPIPCIRPARVPRRPSATARLGRHNGGDGLALPAHTINRNRVLRRRFEALQMREYADPGRNNRCKLRAGHDGDDAGQPPRLRGVDADNFRVRMRRAQEHHMGHPRQFHIADIQPAPLHQPLEVGPRHHFADIGVRPSSSERIYGIWPDVTVMSGAQRACGPWSRPASNDGLVSRYTAAVSCRKGARGICSRPGSGLLQS